MDKSSSATCDVFYTCDGVKGEPSPTWLRKNRGEDEEETGRNGQSRSRRFSFHKYFTTFFSLFLFIDYFYSIIFFYTFFTHNLHPRPTTSNHYPRPTTFSYIHLATIIAVASECCLISYFDARKFWCTFVLAILKTNPFSHHLYKCNFIQNLDF